MKIKLWQKNPSKLAERVGALSCLLLAAGIAVWLRKFTVALPLMVATTLMALAA